MKGQRRIEGDDLGRADRAVGGLPGLLVTGGGMSMQYTWDAENRLIEVEPLATLADGDLKSVYT